MIDARDRAIEHMEAAQRSYGHVLCPLGVLLAAIPADILRALADERRMEQR
jgi:predicted outer membrane lipoprotein